MQIQQTLQNNLGIIRNIPNQLLAGLVVGQRLDAVVMTAALTAQIVSLKVADSLLEIRSPIPLKQGQIVQLELVSHGDKLTLKLVQAADNTTLQLGQKQPVEAIKVLADNRLLVENKATSQQFDVDISKLGKTYQVGDKLIMEVMAVKPLAIGLKEVPISRQQLVLDRIKQLLPQLAITPNLDNLSKALKTTQLSEPVRREIQNVLKNVLDKNLVNKPQALKQAMQQSGSFTEKQLLSQTTLVNKDFKVNLLRLLQALETELTKSAKTRVGANVAELPPATRLASSSQAMTIAQLLSKAVSTEQARVVLPELTALQGLLKEAESVYAKLQFNQFTMLKEPESSSVLASWLLDLPLKDKSNIDFIQLQIDQHKGKAEESEQNEIWNVQLRLDTQNLGPVQATVTMDEEDVKVVLRAERQQSAALLEQWLPQLHDALAKLDISISHISCSHGEVSKPILAEQYQTTTNSLVDLSV